MLTNMLVLAAVIERTWEHLQQLIGEKNLSLRTKLLGSAAISIVAAASFRLDIFYALELTGAVSPVGVLMTGIALGLGSNVIHDLVDLIGVLGSSTRPAGGRK